MTEPSDDDRRPFDDDLPPPPEVDLAVYVDDPEFATQSANEALTAYQSGEWLSHAEAGRLCGVEPWTPLAPDPDEPPLIPCWTTAASAQLEVLSGADRDEVTQLHAVVAWLARAPSFLHGHAHLTVRLERRLAPAPYTRQVVLYEIHGDCLVVLGVHRMLRLTREPDSRPPLPGEVFDPADYYDETHLVDLVERHEEAVAAGKTVSHNEVRRLVGLPPLPPRDGIDFGPY